MRLEGPRLSSQVGRKKESEVGKKEGGGGGGGYSTQVARMLAGLGRAVPALSSLQVRAEVDLGRVHT